MTVCLICGVSIKIMQMRIDACRACAVFYRRAKRTKRILLCKSSENCNDNGKILDCRRCRFILMKGILEKAELDKPLISETIPDEEPSIRPLSPLRRPSMSTFQSGTPVLDRVRCAYNVMSRMRRSSELCMRSSDQFVHPSNIDNNTFPIVPATHASHHRSAQFLLSALFDFATIAFLEFETLQTDVKWLLVRGCYERIHVVESNYRAAKMFPKDPIIFVSYTTILSTQTIDYFLSDATSNVNMESAKSALHRSLDESVACNKDSMKRVNPSEEEFLVLLVLSFWNTVSRIPSANDSLIQLASSNRKAIMEDLQTYYSKKGPNEYASRIGELCCLLVAIEKQASQIREDIELLRVMDVYREQRI